MFRNLWVDVKISTRLDAYFYNFVSLSRFLLGSRGYFTLSLTSITAKETNMANASF